MKSIKTWSVALLALSMVAPVLPASAQEKTLRFVQNGNLTILDPIWTTAYVTRNHAYLIYDTLLRGTRQRREAANGRQVRGVTRQHRVDFHVAGRPGMARRRARHLRGLHRSLKRWGARDAMGAKLMDFVKELKAVDAKTFQMVLKEPYGLVLNSLGKPSAVAAFMMPKAVAETDPYKQIDSQVGSGPFIYQKATSKAGERHVYIKNPKYKPRLEPPSGLAGGKVAKVDRVEIVEMPDTQQQVNAIIAGEIDLIEQPPHDLLPILKKAKDVRLVSWNPYGHQFVFRMNHVVKPFDDPRVRMAALLALRQEDYLKATIGDPEYYKICTAAFICDTPNAFAAPGDLLVKPDFAKARALFKEAGYDGTPIVVLQSTTLPVLTNTAPVTKQLLEQAGFKVDMQSMDFQTLATRRTGRTRPTREAGTSFTPSQWVPTSSIRSRPPSWARRARSRCGAGRPIPRWNGSAMPTPRRPIRPRQGAWPVRCRHAPSRPRSMAGSVSGTAPAPSAPTSPVG